MSGFEPLTSLHYECAVSGCWALHKFANPAQATGFPFPALPTFAGLACGLGSSGVRGPWIIRVAHV
jgi:hypothetical protein